MCAQQLSIVDSFNCTTLYGFTETYQHQQSILVSYCLHDFSTVIVRCTTSTALTTENNWNKKLANTFTRKKHAHLIKAFQLLTKSADTIKDRHNCSWSTAGFCQNTDHWADCAGQMPSLCEHRLDSSQQYWQTTAIHVCNKREFIIHIKDCFHCKCTIIVAN